jgi:hypothetical protein
MTPMWLVTSRSTRLLVGEHLELVRLDSVEDLAGDRLRADLRCARCLRSVSTKLAWTPTTRVFR